MKNFMKHDFVIDKITLACLVKAGTGTNIHKNRKNHGLALFPNGERTIVFEEKKELSISKNSIVYFPKGSNYNIKSKNLSDCYAINFEMADSTTFEPFSFNIKNLTDYLESFKRCDNLWKSKKTAYATKVKSELYDIIYHMQKEYAMPYHSNKYNQIKPAVDYILSHYTTGNIDIPYLAEMCKMTPANLRICFIEEFGVSTLKYINNLKFKRAEELLLPNIYTISDVCFLAGFNDESYFSREFKKRYGVSPANYSNRLN